MSGDDFIVVPAIAILSCGIAAVALEPRNLASRLMLAAGLAGGAAFLLMPYAGDHHHPSATASLLRVAGYVPYLLLVASLAGLLVVFPSGRPDRRWLGLAIVALMAAAVLGPLLQLVGSPTLSANGDSSTDVRNVVVLRGLRVFGHVGDLAVASEPLWIVAGVVVFVWRFRRADALGRVVLRPLLAGVSTLAGLLVLVVVADVGGFEWPQPWFQYIFLAALSSIPVVLLAGLSQRSRSLNRELAASRSRLLTAEDDARRRLERDLHDGVQTQLVAMLSLAGLAARQARTGSGSVPATVDELRAQLTETIEELRELVNGIRPPVLADSGVAAALESRMRRLPAEVDLDLAQVRDRRWSAETEAAAYFVACEAVTNALKHAPGAPVRVRLTADGGDLHVEVVDGGPGPGEGASRGSGCSGCATGSTRSAARSRSGPVRRAGPSSAPCSPDDCPAASRPRRRQLPRARGGTPPARRR